MSEMAPIRYRGFYDVPRIFLTCYRGTTYLFDCPFDEELEDDSDFYNVYAFPSIKDEDLPEDWTTLHERATQFLSKVPVSSVRFDPTRRQAVDIAVIESLIERPIAHG